MSTNVTIEEKAAAPARRAFHLRSIRTRLLVIFILLVLLPAVIIGVVAVVNSWRSGEQQAFNQLETLAILKQGEIESWVNDLQLDLNAEAVRDRGTEQMIALLRAAPDTADYQAASTTLLSRFQQTIELRKNFEELFLMDPKGRVVLSSDTAQLGKAYDKQEFFVKGLKSSYVHPPFYSTSLSRMSVIAVQPVKDEQGQVVGVLAGRANIARLSQIMTQATGLGLTGEAYLVGSNSALLTAVRSGEAIGYVHSQGSARAIETKDSGSGLYDNYQGTPVLGAYRWLPGLQVALVAEQAQSEAFLATYTTLGYILGIALLAVLAAAAIGFVVTRGIANPLANLAETSAKIAGGDLTARAQAITSGDEIGVLATSFNAMADRVGTLLTGLAERSRELEAGQRVAVAASERVSPDDLLDLVVNLVRDQFNLYHVQVYVVDEEQAAAVLRQSTGFAGRQLMQKGHKIPLDRPALVTQAIREGQPVLVDDVTRTAGFLPNPLLPDTKSELVVPLKVSDKVIGVLDAQDRAPGRFGQSTVALFQTMANQISFLFENSQLLERTTIQTEALNLFTNQLRTAADIAHRLGAILDPERLLQQVVELMQSRFGLYHAHIYVLDEATGKLAIRAGSGEVGRVLRERGHSISLDAEKSLVARAARDRETVLVNDTTLESDFMPNPLLPQTRSEVALPLVVGDKVLGVLDVQDDQAGRFTQADLDTFATLTGQVATSLQNASLFGQVGRNLEETRVRLDVSQALAPAQTEEEVLDAIMQRAGLYPQAQVTLFTFDPEAEERTLILRRYDPFESEASYGVPVGTRMAASRFPLLNLITQDEPFVTTNVRTDERVDDATRELASHGSTATAVIPVAAGTEFLGVLVAVAKQEGYFDERKVHLYQTLAEQGAIALRTARLRDATRENEERFRRFSEVTQEGLVFHEGGKIVDANEPLAAMFGYSDVSELLGQKLLDFIAPESREAVVKQLQSGSSQPYEALAVRKDGTVFPVEATGQVYEFEGHAIRVGAIHDITERKQAAEALRENEERFRSIVEHSHTGIFTLDNAFHFVYVNDRMAEIMGYSPEELVGLDFRKVLTPESLALVSDYYVRRQKGEKVPDRYEITFIHKGGEQRSGELSAVVVRDTAGNVRTVGQLLDITERKQAQEALDMERNLLRSLIDNVPDYIYVKDRDSRFLMGNPAVAQMMGAATADELIGKNDFDFYPEELAAKYHADEQAIMQSGQPLLQHEEPVIDPTGNPGWLSTTKVPLRDAQGHIFGLVGMGRNITEQKRTAEMVRESQQMLQLVMNNIPQSIFWKDRNLTYLGCNRNFADDAALATPDEIVGKNDYDMPWVDQAELYRADDSRVMDSGEPVLGYEEPQTTSDGSQIWLRTSKVPLRDATGNVTAVLGMYEDITERKRAEKELADTRVLMESAFEQTPIPMVLASMPDMAIRIANSASREFLGVQDEPDSVGTPLLELKQSWQDLESDGTPLGAGELPLALALQGVTTRNKELRVRRKDGTERWELTNAGPIYNAAGELIAGFVAFPDITETKRAEQAVRESEEKFKALADNLAVGVFIHQDGIVRYMGQEGVRLLGYDSPADLIGSPIMDYVHPAERKRIAEIARQRPAGQSVPDIYETQLLRRDGSAMDVVMYGTLIEYEGRVATQGAFLDITERKQAEAERERFTTQLGTAADVAGQVGAILDPDQLLNAVIPLLHDRFQLYHVHFYGLDAAAGELVLRAGYGEPGRIMLERGHKIPLAREQSLVARAARTREAVLVNDVTSAPDFLPNPLLPETRSEIAVPAIAGGLVLGVFDVQQNVAGYFTEADLDVFTTLTGQIATALQNAGYVELVESRLHVSQTLAGAQTEEQVLDAMIKAADFYPQAQVSIFTLVGGAGELTAAVRRVDSFTSGLQLVVQPGMAFPASMFTILNLISADKPYISANALTDERVDPASRELVRQTGGVSLAVVPITARDEWMGLIIAASPHESYFDERKLYLYDSLAEQGAIALHTARLRDQVQESLTETRVRFEVSQALASVQTEEEVLDAIIRHAGIYPEARVTINMIDPSANELTTVLCRAEAFDSGLVAAIPLGTRFTARHLPLLQQILPDAAFVSPNISLDERVDPLSRELTRQQGGVSMAIVPITAGNEWLGVITATSKIEGYFDADKLHLYRTLAEQGAVALRTARLYDETQRTSERLKEVDRLKSEFLANMSHELRTPLNSILGYTEVMLMGIDGEMDPETQADVQAIYDNGQHLLQLISDILDLAKIEAGRLNLNFETVDMRPLIDEIVTSTNGLLLKRQKSVEFNVEIAGDLPVAQVDRLRLNQILNNLLSNAVKFTEEGHIILRAVGDGDHICLEVEDTGIGISPADQEKIFDQFRQADGSYKRRAEGTGLGLSITRHLVQMHGGTIAVHSQPGQGSTFTVRLPFKRQTVEQGTAASVPSTGKGKGRGKGK